MRNTSNNLPETADYKLSVQPAVRCKRFRKKRIVYAVINKVTNVIEAELDFLHLGYEAIYDLQKRLDTCRGYTNPRCINDEEKKLLN
tara:strand:- start:4044 stop:4304 length:261 start_codon:yes stop_codon:yes gene_type:complete